LKWKGGLTAEHGNARSPKSRRLRQSFAPPVGRLSPQQLDTSYRPGGWTVRQLAHHVPDSHMHSYLRFKLALNRRAAGHQRV